MFHTDKVVIYRSVKKHQMVKLNSFRAFAQSIFPRIAQWLRFSKAELLLHAVQSVPTDR